MFSDAALYSLLIPIIIEQFLNALMGMADTMMISNLGSAAISAVSLTDSINTLMIQVFAALAAGGTVICSQYLGQQNIAQCNKNRQAAASHYSGAVRQYYYVLPDV